MSAPCIRTGQRAARRYPRDVRFSAPEPGTIGAQRPVDGVIFESSLNSFVLKASVRQFATRDSSPREVRRCSRPCNPVEAKQHARGAIRASRNPGMATSSGLAAISLCWRPGQPFSLLHRCGRSHPSIALPRVLFEPPTFFKAGRPEEYAVGEVSEKWMKAPVARAALRSPLALLSINSPPNARTTACCTPWTMSAGSAARSTSGGTSVMLTRVTSFEFQRSSAPPDPGLIFHQANSLGAVEPALAPSCIGQGSGCRTWARASCWPIRWGSNFLARERERTRRAVRTIAPEEDFDAPR